MSARRLWIAAEDDLPIVRQCALAGVTRSTVYAHPEPVQPIELELLKLIDEEYTHHPFYGSRRMVQILKNKGHTVNRKDDAYDISFFDRPSATVMLQNLPKSKKACWGV